MKNTTWSIVCIGIAACAFYAGLSLSPDSGVKTTAPPTSQNTADRLPVVQHSATTKPASNNTLVTSSEDTSADTAETPQLPQEPDAHSEQLIRELMALQNKYGKAQQDLATAYQAMEAAGVPLPETLSDKAIKEALPSPFSDFIVFTDVQTKQDYEAFLNEDVDEAWSVDIQTRITDFFELHDKSYEVQLERVTCRNKTCEILGYETTRDVFHLVIRDLIQQPWFMSAAARTYSSTPPQQENNETNPTAGYFMFFAEIYKPND